MNVDDRSCEVRSGEELDVKRLEEFLKDSIRGLEGNVSVEQFPSGYSNLTYLVRMSDREFVIRRPPFGHKAKTAHDMGREYRMLTALKPVFDYCPEPLVFTEDESIIGSPFYVMTRIKGIILRRDLPAGLNLTDSQMWALCENLVDVHHELHAVDYKSIGLGAMGKPEGYVKRQVGGWSQRYRAARTPDAPSFDYVMSWLSGEMPPDCHKPALIHNDYKFDNVVLDSGANLKIKGVLDWEMATIGDPLMDLGSSLGYWVQSDDSRELQAIRTLPTNRPGALTRKQLVKRYAEKSGMTIDNFDFYYCFGLFRLAAIAQQIYFRFYHGQTKDIRFKSLIGAVHVLENTALKVVGRGF